MKLPNLVYDSDTGTILMIDFGTSFQTQGKLVTLKAASLECMPLFMKIKEMKNGKEV